MDLLVPVVLAGLLWLMPFDISVSARVGATAAILCSIVAGLIVERLVSAGWKMTAVMTVRIVVVVLLTLFIPELWIPGLVFVTAASAAAASYEPRADGLAFAAGGALGLAITGVLIGQQSWLPPLPGLIVMTMSIRKWTADWRLQGRETDRRFDDLVDTANLFFWEVDPVEQRLVSVTGNSLGTIGYHPDEVKDLDWFELIHPDDRSLLMTELSSDRFGASDRIDLVIRLIHRNGHPVAMRNLIRLSPSGKIIGAAADISELVRATDALRHQAHHDALTGLANRLLLTETLDRAFDELNDDSHAHERDDTPRVALLLFDLDGFKGINDTLGHATGDQVLEVLAHRLRGSLTEVELCARVGGDEFAIVLGGDVDEESAMTCARNLVNLIQEPLPLAGLRLSVKLSVGVALAPDHATNAEQLMQRADVALYQAKDSVDRVCMYESMPEEISMERLKLSADINDAFYRNEFELWFQPKVDLVSGRTIGVEGLARWRHPELGVLMPAQFLPLLGVSGAYQRFTDQVVAQGIEFAGACHRGGHYLSVAVNLGSVSFLDTGLPDRISRLLEVHQVPAEYLYLEVTEDELLLDRDSSSEVFLALEKLGVQLSIDDFGTGYSSLSRLRGLQIQEVKIDRSFVNGLGIDPEDWAIVRTIIELARMLGKTTVAEGIETVQQMSILQSLGCDVAQGFLFEKAIPAQDLFARLTTGDVDFSYVVTAQEHVTPELHPVGPTTPTWVRDGVTIPTDASDIRESLETIEGQNQVLLAMIELVPFATWVKDAQARYLRANAQMRNLLGVDEPTDLIGRTETDFFENGQEVMNSYADDLRVLGTGQPMVGQSTTQMGPDGARVSSLVTKVPVFNSDGLVIGLIGTSTVPGGMASAHRAAERRLERSGDVQGRAPVSMHDAVRERIDAPAKFAE